MHGSTRLTPELVLRAYAEGIFPMAERRDDPALYWVSPERRGIIPLDAFHVPKRLARTVKSDRFTVTSDLAFVDVMKGCAEAAAGREESWINDEIIRLYSALHSAGFAHSIESWQDGKLVGGLYGLHLGGAFFGESMFARERDASKTALVHLVARLIAGGFALLDTQFITAHLAQFGTIEIAKAEYLARLKTALPKLAYWPEPSGNGASPASLVTSGEVTLAGAWEARCATVSWPGALVLQLITQTS